LNIRSLGSIASVCALPYSLAPIQGAQ
jgi:hypothetical protein